MAETLSDRFFRLALSPLSALLQIVGVFVNQNLDSQWRQRFYRSGTFFFLILAIQSNIYIFVRRSKITEIFFSSQKINDLIQDLVNELTRFIQLVSDIIVHLSLVFKIWPSITLFLETLESVDLQFKRPSLSPIKRYSLLGLIYMLFMVRFSFKKFNKAIWCTKTLFFTGCFKLDIFHLYQIKISIDLLAGYFPEFDKNLLKPVVGLQSQSICLTIFSK